MKTLHTEALVTAVPYLDRLYKDKYQSAVKVERPITALCRVLFWL